MGYTRTILDNGIRIITEAIPHVRSVSLGIWIETGSRYEKPDELGISHFIEHMLFKGTDRRSARQIAEQFDSVGAQVNAFTAKEYTCFYVKVLDSWLSMAIDILSDMVLKSKLSEGEIEREKGVVMEEIRSYEDSPEDIAHDLSAVAVFGTHPLSAPILGTPETVQSFDEDKLRNYMTKWYTPGRIVISVAGSLQHNDVVDAICASFGSMPSRKIDVSLETESASPRLLVREKDVEQSHLVICGPGASRSHATKMPMLVLDTILGGGMSSRLFQELREERGLVYSTYSYHTSFFDTGTLSAYAGMSPDNLGKVATILKAEVQMMVEKGATEAEVRRAKEHLKGNLVLGLESTSNRQSRLAKMELFHDRLYTPDEVLSLIDEVSTAQVEGVIHHSLTWDKLSGALVGPMPVDEVKGILDNFIMPVLEA